MAFFVKSLLVNFAFLFVEYAHGDNKVRQEFLLPVDKCYGTDHECGELTWKGLCKNGTRQSPINLPVIDNLLVKESWTIDKKSFNLVNYTVVNNALAFRVLADFNYDDRPQFFVPYLGATYIYNSFHIHWGNDTSKGSEHSVQGKFYPAELHIFLYRDTYESLNEALLDKEYDAVLAMSFFLIDSSTSKLLSELEDQVPFRPSNRTSKRPLNIAGLFKAEKAWTYFGASSFPPCNEDIVFLIFEEPVEVAAAFMKSLRKMKNRLGMPLSNNFKSIAPIIDHQIFQVKIEYK